MEEIYTSLNRVGLNLEEAACARKAPFGSSQNRYSSSDLGSPEHLEQLIKTRNVVASTSFRKSKDTRASKLGGTVAGTGAKFEYLGKTSYSFRESSKAHAQRKASTSSAQSSLTGKPDRKRKGSPGNAAGSKPEKDRQSSRISGAKCGATINVRRGRNGAASNDTGGDSSDELNLTSSSQPMESPEKRSITSSDPATGPPDSDSDDYGLQTKKYTVGRSMRAAPLSLRMKSETAPSSSTSRSRNDENSFDETPPKRARIKPRPAYGKKNGLCSSSNPKGSLKGMNSKISVAGATEVGPSVPDKSRGNRSANVSSYQPIKALLGEKRKDESLRPRKSIKDRVMYKPAPFPMIETGPSFRTGRPKRDCASFDVAAFLMSKDEAYFNEKCQKQHHARKPNVEVHSSDDAGSESDDDPLSWKRNDEIINRGGLAPFPMSLRGGPVVSREPPSGSPICGSRNGGEQSPARKRRRSDGVLGVDDSNEHFFTQSTDHPDPKTLCAYCDMPFPRNPSPLLLDMLKRIPKYPDARPSNPLGLTAPLLSYVSMCQRHQFEAQLLPTAEAAGWPICIDFAALPKRVVALRKHLGGILCHKERSVLWRELRKDIDKRGARKTMGLADQFNTFEKSQPGYYGEQGSIIISQTLNNLFPPGTIDAELLAPLTPAEFIQRILIPECAVALIQEDSRWRMTVKDAVRTLRDSSKYGTAMFPDLDNRDGTSSTDGGDGGQLVCEAMFKERVRARRKEIDEEERVEDALRESEKEVRKDCTLRGPRKTMQRERIDENGEATSSQDANTTGKVRAKVNAKVRTNGGAKGDDVIELSESSAVQTDASIVLRTKKRRNSESVVASDCAVSTMKSRTSPIHHQSKLVSASRKSRPRPIARSKASSSGFSSGSESGIGANEATPRPRNRIRTECCGPDLDIILPEEGNRCEKPTRSMTVVPNSRSRLNGSLQPLQAVKARKAVKEAVFRCTMWEEDDSEAEESNGSSRSLHSEAGHSRRAKSLVRKDSNSWLLSEASSGTPAG